MTAARLLRSFCFCGLAFLSLVGCAPDENVLAPIISEISAFDVGNSHSAEDVLVVFKPGSDADISEFRILILPTAAMGSFDKKDALNVPFENYISVPRRDITEYFIRLSNLPDILGNAVVQDKSYVLALLVEGSDFNQLSEFSNEFMLTDAPIYNGYYEGTLTMKSDQVAPNTVSPLLESNWNISIELTEGVAGYCGEFFPISGELKFGSGIPYYANSTRICLTLDPEDPSVFYTDQFDMYYPSEDFTACMFKNNCTGAFENDLIFKCSNVTGKANNCPFTNTPQIVVSQGSVVLRRRLKPN